MWIKVLLEKSSTIVMKMVREYKKVVEEDELYRPEQDVNLEHDFSSSIEDIQWWRDFK